MSRVSLRSVFWTVRNWQPIKPASSRKSSRIPCNRVLEDMRTIIGGDWRLGSTIAVTRAPKHISAQYCAQVSFYAQSGAIFGHNRLMSAARRLRLARVQQSGRIKCKRLSERATTTTSAHEAMEYRWLLPIRIGS
jgi:hypothetical protein